MSASASGGSGPAADSGGGSPPSPLPVTGAVLVVLDGWGLADPGPGNAVSQARTPVFDDLWGRYPTTTLTAWGRAVGLPEGQMGNSEVGHLNLGAGSVVMQDLTRIDAAAADGSLAENPVLRDALTGGSGRVHVIGLVSDGGVHSSMEHLRALIEMAAALGVDDLVVHAFTDGRDTLAPQRQSLRRASWSRSKSWMASAGVGRVATVTGRYYAMDRDKRWERVEKRPTNSRWWTRFGPGTTRPFGRRSGVSAAYERGGDRRVHPAPRGSSAPRRRDRSRGDGLGDLSELPGRPRMRQLSHALL